MIVQCCICKVIEGVKCPKCGESLPETGPQAPLDVYMVNGYICPNPDCGAWFYGQDGGVSHGYCKPCFRSEMAKIPKKLPAFAFYLQ